jgi:hypothetical protein
MQLIKFAVVATFSFSGNKYCTSLFFELWVEKIEGGMRRVH